MLPSGRIPSHPGEILLKEFLEPMCKSQVELARELNVPVQRVNEIVKGKRGVSAETAWLLARAFGTSAEFWANLQTQHDLALCRPRDHVA